MGAHVLASPETIAVAAAAHARARSAESDAPADARTWLYGRLLELHSLPLPSRVVFWFWCRVLHQPLPEFYDLQGSYGTRAEARAECRDALDYLVALPYGRKLSRKVTESPTFCRPVWGPHEERDREHAQLYREDLSSHFSAVNLAAFRQLVYELEKQKESLARLR